MPVSKITWGTGFENELIFGYSLFDVITDREPREGSEWIQGASGIEDAWITGRDYTMHCEARWIPDNPGGALGETPVSGPTAFQAFLDWARDKNTFRFVPDASVPLFFVDSCYLVEPVRGFGSLTADIKRRLPLKLRTVTMDFHQALRGVMFEYAPGGSLIDPVAATYSRGSTANRIGKDGLVASEAINVLRDRHYEGSLKTALLETH